MHDASQSIAPQSCGVRRDADVNLGTVEHPHSAPPQFGNTGELTTDAGCTNQGRIGVRRAVVAAPHTDQATGYDRRLDRCAIESLRLQLQPGEPRHLATEPQTTGQEPEAAQDCGRSAIFGEVNEQGE